MSILREELITNHLLLDYFDMWEEFDISKVEDPKTIRYYDLLMNHIQNQIDAGIKWLDSDEARDYFFGESQYQKEVFSALEDEWDEILEGKYPSVEALLSEVYRRGKAKGYSDMRERIRYTETDKLALDFVTNYNFGLITKIDDDTRNQIRNKITEAVIAGEHPYTVAPKILSVAEEKLEESNFTPRQRATMIARTEISRVQNTGILQSYVNEGYTEVKILTAEDNHVCDLCLRYAFEFNEDDEIIFENRGEEKVHDIYKLLRGGLFPPFHPLCRCTYLVVWGSKGKRGIPNDFIFANGTPNKSKFFEKYKAPDDAKPIVLDEEILEKELDGIIDSNDIPILLALFEKFNETTLNCDYEWIIGETNDGYSPKKARSDWKKTEVKLHYSLRNLESPEKLLVVIHNHIWGMTPLPSEKDLVLYLDNNIKYGITTNEMGLFVIRNNNKNKLSEEDMDNLNENLMNMDKSLVKKFEKDRKMKFDQENDNHKYLLNEYLKDNFEEWKDEYTTIYFSYGMKVKFINAKKYNIN